MKNLSLYIAYLFIFLHYSVSARIILKNICIDIDSVQISRDWDRRGTYFLRGNDHWRHPRQSHRPTSCLCGRYSNTKKKWTDIVRLVQSTTPLSLLIQELQIELIKLRDVDNVKLSLCDKYLYMKRPCSSCSN